RDRAPVRQPKIAPSQGASGRPARCCRPPGATFITGLLSTHSLPRRRPSRHHLVGHGVKETAPPRRPDPGHWGVPERGKNLILEVVRLTVMTTMKTSPTIGNGDPSQKCL